MPNKTINNPRYQYVDSAGEVLDGGKIYTYEAGTVTPKTTYSDIALTVPNANPVILDSNGEATIYGLGPYKLVLNDSADVLIKTDDNITASAANDVTRVDIDATYAGSLTDAIAGIGASEVTLTVSSAITLTANDIVPANITLEKMRGGSFTGAFTLTINGGMTGDLSSTWFDSNLVAVNGLSKVPSVNPLMWGAGGAGATDDTDAINSALLSAREVIAGKGTYEVTGVLITKPNASLIIDSDATITLANSSDTHIITVSAAATNCLVTGGGTLQGNKANQASGNGIQIAGDDCTIDNIKVVDAFSYGIHTLDADRPIIKNNTITDSDNIGIYVQNNITPSNVTGAVIDGNFVDRSSLAAATVTGPGITAHALDPSGKILEIEIINNRVLMPSEPTDGSAVCIECWGTFQSGSANGNITRGGSIGISFGGDTGLGVHAVIVGNICRNFDKYGIEVAECDFVTVTGNNVNGASLGSTSVGIGTSGVGAESDYCSISGNIIRGCTEASIQSIADSDNLSITGNTINHAAVTSAIWLIGTDNTTISGNVINGLTTGTNAIELNTSSNVTVTGNAISSFATVGVLLKATIAYTITNISIVGNTFNSVLTPLASALSGGGVLGGDIVVSANAGLADYLAFGADIKHMFLFAATPEGSVVAGIGSTAINTTGGAGTTFYVKESGAGNTGWVGK